MNRNSSGGQWVSLVGLGMRGGGESPPPPPHHPHSPTTLVPPKSNQRRPSPGRQVYTQLYHKCKQY